MQAASIFAFLLTIGLLYGNLVVDHHATQERPALRMLDDGTPWPPPPPPAEGHP
jgi:hypothetical protein